MARLDVAVRRRLEHMRSAATSIARYAAAGRDRFAADRTLQDAVLYQLVVLGEAAKAVLEAEPTVADRHPAIEWRAMARMRDRIAHRYWTMDPAIVWETIATDVPALGAHLDELLAVDMDARHER